MTIVLAVAGLALLYFGGEWLIRGASALAIRNMKTATISDSRSPYLNPGSPKVT